jgi:hypothetical protein
MGELTIRKEELASADYAHLYNVDPAVELKLAIKIPGRSFEAHANLLQATQPASLS